MIALILQVTVILTPPMALELISTRTIVTKSRLVTILVIAAVVMIAVILSQTMVTLIQIQIPAAVTPTQICLMN